MEYYITAAILILLWLYFENNLPSYTSISVKDASLPKGFDGYKICHLSDLHGKSFRLFSSSMLKKIREEKPDIIVMTGDLLSNWSDNTANIDGFLKSLYYIAPFFMITGNHDNTNTRPRALQEAADKCGAVLMRNETMLLSRNGETVYLTGIDDPVLLCGSIKEANKKSAVDSAISGAISNAQGGRKRGYTILLAHRPEPMETYRKAGINLALTGHVHGGQIRIPFTNIGLLSPGRHFFPKYSAGLYKEGDTSMVVSRGLGKSSIPQRLFNRPEIVFITLETVNS